MKQCKQTSWAVLTAWVLCAVPAWAAVGVPDVKREVRAKEAIKKLQTRPHVALLYVRGMT